MMVVLDGLEHLVSCQSMFTTFDSLVLLLLHYVYNLIMHNVNGWDLCGENLEVINNNVDL